MLRILALIIISVTITCAQTVKLKFVETTDVHGKVFPYDFKNDKESRGSLAQLQTYLNEQRADESQQVILLDNGDILQGTPVVYYYNFERTNVPHVYAEVMNYLGYDAATVGNHDIEPGHEVYDRFVNDLEMPWLAANTIRTDNGEPYFRPYTIIEKEDVKIAVLGMVTPGIPNWLPPKIWSGMKFTDMQECAKKWLPIIKKEEQPDMIVGLFHAGFDHTYSGEEEYLNENASQLVAENVPGFDLIFVGHDHHGWDTTVTNIEGKEVFVLGATSSANNVTVADVVLTYDEENKTWSKQIDGYTVNISDYESDPDFMSEFNYAYEDVKDYVNTPIGKFTRGISTREAMFGNGAFTDLIHKIQLELTDADVSFTAPLSFDATINEGTVYVRDMFNLYKYENLLYTMELTGQEIKNYLEYSHGNWFNQMKDSTDHLINFVRDENGGIEWSDRYNRPVSKEIFFNYDAAEGIIYTVDVRKPQGERINIIGMEDGEEFGLNKKYKAAINSYRGNGGGGHLTEGAGIPKDELEARILDSTEKDLRYYMMKWIEEEGKVEPVSDHNWKVIPEEWWMEGMKKDYKLLYGNEN